MESELQRFMIETPSLHLLPCRLEHFDALLRDERELATLLGVSLAPDWLSFDAAREAIPYSRAYLEAHPEDAPWWTHFIVHRADRALLGLGGYKGRPDADGSVEVGYAIAPPYQGRGLATEATRGMIEHAFAHTEVLQVLAHTLPEPNASTRVLEKAGLAFVGPIIDPDDGEIWRWRILRT